MIVGVLHFRSKYNSDSKIKSLQRRNNERTEMVELKTLLPLPEVIKDKMKDGDILKFATTYFKAKASLANYGRCILLLHIFIIVLKA